MFGGEPENPLDYLRDQVHATVADEQRADAMSRTVDDMDAMMVQLADLLVDAAQQERALFQDYDSTPQDFESLFENTSRQRRDMQQALLALHLDFKAQASGEEWAALLPSADRAASARIESLVVDAISKRNN